jgi:hypothetical protein
MTNVKRFVTPGSKVIWIYECIRSYKFASIIFQLTAALHAKSENDSDSNQYSDEWYRNIEW